MPTLHEAQLDYIQHWKYNAYQHFIDGDYDWVANLIKQKGIQRLLEIGCGVGFSTLAIAYKGIQALSIDIIPEAIQNTEKLLTENAVLNTILGEGNGAQVALKQTDLFIEAENIKKWVKQFQIELILICNPGGKVETDLTLQEKKILRWGHFTDDQIKRESVPLLHKWAVLLAAAKIALETRTLLMIVDRGSLTDIDYILNTIEVVANLKGLARTGRKIRATPEKGIQLGNSINDQLYWGAGLYGQRDE